MNNEHPITPPLELVEQRWNNSQSGGDFVQEFATFFARWGADQELEACCSEVSWNGNCKALAAELRTRRRPKPPSDKELALKALERMQDQYPHLRNKATIRRALEALPE